MTIARSAFLFSNFSAYLNVLHRRVVVKTEKAKANEAAK